MKLKDYKVNFIKKVNKMMMIYNVYSIFELKLYHMDIEILIS